MRDPRVIETPSRLTPAELRRIARDLRSNREPLLEFAVYAVDRQGSAVMPFRDVIDQQAMMLANLLQPLLDGERPEVTFQDSFIHTGHDRADAVVLVTWKPGTKKRTSST